MFKSYQRLAQNTTKTAQITLQRVKRPAKHTSKLEKSQTLKSKKIPILEKAFSLLQPTLFFIIYIFIFLLFSFFFLFLIFPFLFFLFSYLFHHLIFNLNLPYPVPKKAYVKTSGKLTLKRTGLTLLPGKTAEACTGETYPCSH